MRNTAILSAISALQSDLKDQSTSTSIDQRRAISMLVIPKITEHYIALSPEDRTTVLGRVSEDLSEWAAAFVRWAPEVAVQQQSEKLLDRALAAMALAYQQLPDLRDLWRTAAIVYRAYELIGVDPAAAFARSASLGSEAFAAYVQDIAARRPTSSDWLRSMGYSEKKTPSGTVFE